MDLFCAWKKDCTQWSYGPRKAMEFAGVMCASGGWLDCFKKRENREFKAITQCNQNIKEVDWIDAQYLLCAKWPSMVRSYVSVSVSPSICHRQSISVSQFLSLSVSLCHSVSVSIFQAICISHSVSVSLSLFVHLLQHVSVRLFLSLCPSVCP